jgi:glycosyltransferase
MYPKVTVITVCFNSAKTVKETIYSVNSQDYPNIEHLFIDGLSSDNSINIIKKESKKHKIISEKDKGIYDAMNKGIMNSDGDIIFILNSDDIFFDNNTVKNVVNKFLETKADFLYGSIMFSKETNIRDYTRSWKVSQYKPKSFLSGWHPPHPGFVVKKSVYEKISLFDIELSVAADFELMMRLFELTDFKHVIYKNYVAILREGGNSTIIKGIIKGKRDISRSFEKNNLQPKYYYFFKRYLIKILQKIEYAFKK